MLLQAKISVPKSDRPLLRRERLLTTLDSASRLLFVNGPAGSGKTSLLISYVSTLERPVIWYTLDSSDADPAVFLRYLTASLATVAPSIHSVLSELIDDRSPEVLIAPAIAQAINTMLPATTLVLDDLHNVEVNGRLAPAIAGVLNALLRYCPSLQVVIASRQMLNLDSIITLLARGEARGVNGDALAFTPDEIDELFVQTFGAPEPVERDRLSTTCAGWTTAVALALTSRAPTTIPAGNDQAMLYAYLANQVLGQLPPVLNDFLLETAVLDYLTSERCDFLRQRADSAELLAETVRHNVFLTAAGVDTYRYHPLFREFLLDRLRRQPAHYQALVTAAIKLAKHEGRWEWAFDLAAQAQRWREAADVIAAVGQQFRVEGRHATLMYWINQLPQSAMRPELWWLKARLLADHGSLDEALLALDFAARGSEHERMLAQLLRAHVEHLQGHLEAAVNLVAPYLKNSSVPPEWRARALRIQSMQLARQGTYDEARQQLQTALDLSRNYGELIDVATINHDLGVVEDLLGKPDRAVQHFRAADACWKQLGEGIHRSTTLNSLGVVLLRLGRTAEAMAQLDVALDLAERFNLPRDLALIRATLGDVGLAMGDFSSATTHYMIAESIAREGGYTWLVHYALAARAHSLRLQGERGALAEVLDQLYAAMPQTQHERSWIKGALGGALWALSLPGAANEVQAALSLLPPSEDHERALLLLLYTQILFGQALVREALHVFEQLQAHAARLSNLQTLTCWAAAAPGLLTLAAERGLPLAVRLHMQMPETVATPAAPPTLTIRTLGTESILRGGTPVGGGGPLTREVFFCLLAVGDRGLSSERLRENVWGETGDLTGQALKTAIKRIRRELCDVRFENGRYVLQLPPQTDYDVDQFLELVRRPTTTERLCAALEFYKGEYLPRITQPWATDLRLTLGNRFVEAAVEVAESLQHSDPQVALEYFRAALQHNPYHVGAMIGAMQAEATLGRRTQALDRFHDYATHMVNELGLDPDQAVHEVYQSLLKGH